MKILNKNVRIGHEALSHVKTPFLSLDGLWQEQFRDAKNKKMIALEGQITDLMKEQARCQETIAALKQKKKESLKQILKMTDVVHEQNSVKAREQTSRLRKEVLDSNKVLESLEKRMLQLPDMLEKANRELLLETINAIYPRMREHQQRAAFLGPEIERLRDALQKASEERIYCEEDAAKSYQLLHNLVGQDIIDILDRQSGWG